MSRAPNRRLPCPHPQARSPKVCRMATIQTGALCHHKAGARDYATGVARECLTRYSGFAGYVLHPPEFVTGCLCDECRAAYRERTGEELREAPDEVARDFVMRTNLEFQRDVLEPVVASLIPKGRAFTFSIPWIFEASFESVADLIPAHHTIIEWDYNQVPTRIATLGERLRRYGSAATRCGSCPLLASRSHQTQPPSRPPGHWVK